MENYFTFNPETANKYQLKDSKPGATLSKETLDKIISKFMALTGCKEKDQAMIAISLICQRGGTNQNTSGKITVTLNDQVFTATQLQNSCKQNGCTPRQLARTLNNEIFAVSSAYGEKGDLAAQYAKQNPNMTSEDAIWCSNFQSENPDCPGEVREWLLEDYRKRFNR